MRRNGTALEKILIIMGVLGIVVLIVISSVLDGTKINNDKNSADIDDYTYERVVIIGVDGAGANFKNVSMPNLQRLAANGAVSYHVLTSEPTISAQCWGSMLTGVTPEVHGLNNDLVASVPYDVHSDHPTIFRMIRERDADAKLASFCGWKPINFGIVEDGIDVYKDSGTDKEITEKVCEYLANNDPKLLFVHFEEVDSYGHGYGYGSKEYYEKLAETDGNIGAIYDALKQQGMLDTTLFIVTADHGGIGNEHGGDSDEEKYVMYLALGKTVQKGSIISDMNIRDNAAIVIKALGYEPLQNWTANIPSGLFETK